MKSFSSVTPGTRRLSAVLGGIALVVGAAVIVHLLMPAELTAVGLSVSALDSRHRPFGKEKTDPFRTDAG